MGYRSQAEYEHAATDLTCRCDGGRPGVLRKQDSISGKTYHYDPSNGEFAITKGRGIIIFYRLDGGMRSFDGLPGELLP